jgi:hypothetical protein
MAMTPARYLPGIGLRPGGECPDLEPLVALLYRAVYEWMVSRQNCFRRYKCSTSVP